MNHRLAVLAFEKTKAMSANDVQEFIDLLSMLQKKYKFSFCRTLNPGWVRALADEMEQDHGRDD